MVDTLAKRSGRLSPAKRMARNLLAGGTLVFYATLGPMGYLAFALLALLPAPNPRKRANRLQDIMRAAFRLFHHWMRWIDLLDYDPRVMQGTVPTGQCIVISNHPSLDDVTTIMSAVPRLCTAVNQITFNRPWLRPLLEQAGQFCGEAPTLLGSDMVLEAAADRLRQGHRVLVFPEGHRSPWNRMRPFARGAFEIACRHDVPIVPILIRSHRRWLAPGDPLVPLLPHIPAKRLEVLDPLIPADFAGDSRAMRDYAEAMYSRLLNVPVARPPLALRAKRPSPKPVGPNPES